MKKTVLYSFIALAFFACSSNHYEPAANALDAGREFVDGCLKGDFNKAGFYLLPDEENRQDLEKIERLYKTNGESKNQEYKTASIVINDIQELNDSVTIMNYKNSYDKIARKLKIVRKADGWKVDFKYTGNGNL